MLTLNEASKYLKVHTSTLYRLVEQDKIPAFKVGKIWRFKKEDIDEWLEQFKGPNNKKTSQQLNGQAQTKDRRKSPRTKTSLPLEIKSKTNLNLAAKSIDISEGGLSLETAQPLTSDPNSIVFLSISDYKRLDGKARIVWSHFQTKEGRYYYGLEFVRIKDNQLYIIRKIIQDKSKQKRKFAFITNLRDAGDWVRVVLTSKFLPKNVQLRYLKDEPGFIVWTHFDVYGKIEGYIITILLTAEEIKSLPPKIALKKVLDACLFAQNELGVDYIGLGSYIPSMTNSGAWLATRPEIKTSLTHGDSYTVAAAMEGIKEKLGLNLKRISAAVIGATGLIGQALSRLLAKECKKLVLVARNPNKLNRLKELIHSENGDLKCDVYASVEMSSIKDVDLIVSVTSSPTALIRDEDLKEGAIIYDLAQPMDVYPGVCNKRPDVLRVDGSIVNIPGIDLGIDTGLPKGSTFACLAEVILQCLEDKQGRYIGPIDFSWIDEAKSWAEKYAFSHVNPSCYSWPIPERFFKRHTQHQLKITAQ